LAQKSRCPTALLSGPKFPLGAHRSAQPSLFFLLHGKKKTKFTKSAKKKYVGQLTSGELTCRRRASNPHCVDIGPLSLLSFPFFGLWATLCNCSYNLEEEINYFLAINSSDFKHKEYTHFKALSSFPPISAL